MRWFIDQTMHRESLEIHADYDAHIPPRLDRMQCRQYLEIQADYDAQIPLPHDRLHASSIHNQTDYEPQSPPKKSLYSALNQAA
jgi:hypothetical protein